MSSTYYALHLGQVPDSLEELITHYCFEAGASGVSESLIFQQPDLTYDPQLIPQKRRDLVAYFEQSPPSALLQQLQAIDPGLRLELRQEATKDWLAEWKKGFKPFALSGPYWIVPSWEESPVADEFALRIDPGMAFGTGTHATTKMASSFLVKIAAQAPRPSSVLDVGTGTAVLAILADRLGFAPVVGVEIDPEARRVARENMERNEALNVSVVNEPLEEIEGEYPIVVANIIDGVLIHLQKDLERVTSEGGALFCTGILAEREENFVEGFIKAGPWRVARRWELEGWIGYWLERGPSA